MQQQKIMLIDSMTKLINHISNNHRHQRQIYSNLSKNDVLKIISNFDDNNPTVRKISAQLLCQLMYNNPQVKSKFLGDMGIQHSQGNIVLGRLHKIQNIGEILLNVKKAKINTNGGLCWYTKIDRNVIQILKKGDEFIDPIDCIFGITCEKEQLSEPLRFTEMSQRFSIEKQKQYNREGITRSRGQNNSLQITGNKDAQMMSKRIKDESKMVSSTYRQVVSTTQQIHQSQQLNISSIKSPIRTANYTEQGQISFQARLKQEGGIYIPKSVRQTSTSFGETLGHMRTNRDPNGLNGSFQGNYIRLGQIKR